MKRSQFWFNRSAVVLIAAVAMCAGCASRQASFASPDAAAQSLVDAERTHSTDQLRSVFGKGSEDLISSGDAVQDKNLADRFVQLYDEQHQLTPADDGSQTLVIGKNQWPFPIPLVKDAKSGEWTFDTNRGKDELINRRIGRNELSTIQVCMAIIDAERDYVQRTTKNRGPAVYAARFISHPGQYDGLYWDAKEGEPQSPLGPLVADAVDEGYEIGKRHQPYHGYFYHIISAQGPNANNGAYDYMVDGKLIGGVAVIARPAEYGKSGVMTFMINHEGTVYQKDLGPDTEKIAKAMKTFDPGQGWVKAN